MRCLPFCFVVVGHCDKRKINVGWVCLRMKRRIAPHHSTPQHTTAFVRFIFYFLFSIFYFLFSTEEDVPYPTLHLSIEKRLLLLCLNIERV
ncbi:hypothetical protein BDF14DRAFT_75128 [Spinellus fusiger]|nr:hypothetical protein BDF14DRAFT_75128 [Spinellus fusiger]